MKIANLKGVKPTKAWFGVKSTVETNLLDRLPRDAPDCPGDGMALMYFRMEADETFPMHYHPNSRIIIVWSGTGWVSIEAEEFALVEFDCFSMPPRVHHTFRAGPGGLTILSVHSTYIDPEDDEFM